MNTMTDRMTNREPLWGLPDPDSQAEFYADIPTKRAIAWLLDTVAITLITALVVLFTVGIGLFFIGFMFLVVGITYRVVTIATRSATPGMRLVAIELRSHRGERLGFGPAVLHTLGYTLSMSFVFPQLISIVLMLTGARAQGLTDMVMGTAAINRNAAA